MPKEHRPLRVRSLFLPILTSLVLADAAPAAVSVDPPQPVTHRVKIQPIQVRESSTGPIANFMGNASSEAYIKDQINLVWAQVGVEIEWLEAVEYTDRFAYNGWPGNYTTSSRPTSHLGTILSEAGIPPKSDDPTILNFFFVEIAAGFRKLSSNSVAGLANVDRSGSTVYVGGSLLTWSAGRDVVASVIAHEIGHNLGLSHYQADISNLMYSGSNGNGEELISSQENIIFTDRGGYDGYDFLQALPPESYYLAWSDALDLREGPEGDDDKDGLSNAFEFLNGSDPLEFTLFPASESTPSGLVWTLNKQADAIADGFSYQAESSLDLDDWKVAGSADSHSSVLQDDNDAFRVLLEGGRDQNFIRFNVTIPPAAAVATTVAPAMPLAGALPVEPEHEHDAVSGCGIGGCGHRTLYRE